MSVKRSIVQRITDHAFVLRITRTKRIYALVGLCLLVVLAFFTVRFRILGHFEGLFLLRGTDGYLLELKDDLYLGDHHRLIYGIDFDDPRYHIAQWFDRAKHEVPYLTCEWVAKDGEGYVRSFLPGGQELVTNFSRFTDEAGSQTAGLIVGGGLPANVLGDNNTLMNETGMTFFNGKRWFHIWCNVNEMVASAKTLTPIYPSHWKFLGSEVLNRSDKELTLASQHMIKVDNVPLRMDRTAFFKAGETFFILSVRVRNLGNEPVTYFYTYADEPWLGNYGTSGGNVGWVKDGLIQRVGPIDTRKYTFAGMFDYGNDLIGEGHDFTNTANFLEWKSARRPTVYFTNGAYDKYDPANHDPLYSNTRFIGVEWGPCQLLPGESDQYYLAIGMAPLDPQTGLPVKPETHLYP